MELWWSWSCSLWNPESMDVDHDPQVNFQVLYIISIGAFKKIKENYFTGSVISIELGLIK